MTGRYRPCKDRSTCAHRRLVLRGSREVPGGGYGGSYSARASVWRYRRVCRARIEAAVVG